VALRSFDVTSGQVGIFMGLGIAALGAASLAGTGFMADALNKKSRVQPVRLIALFQYLVVPLMLATLFAPTFTLFMVTIALAYAAIVSNSSVAWSVTQNSTPPEMRASAAASMALIFNLVGLGLGPPLAGFISDQLTGQFGDESLRYALMLVAVSSLVAGLLLSFWVVPAVKEREAATR
jgi:MFS family permease